MRMKANLIAMALAMILPFPSPASALENQAETSLSDEQMIVAWGNRWQQLFEAGDVEQMAEMYETDAVLMANGALPQIGVDAILSFLGRNKAAGNEVSIDFANEDIVIDRDRAYLTAKYWMTITLSGDKSVDVRGRSFLVFKKGKNGQWRLWRDIDNQAPDVLAQDRPAP